MHIFRIVCLSVFALLVLGACSAGTPDEDGLNQTLANDDNDETSHTAPSEDNQALDDESCTDGSIRSLLSFCTLTKGEELTDPVEMSAFAMPANATEASHIFEGKLKLSGSDSRTKVSIISTSIPVQSIKIPDFNFEFIQDGGDLIPVKRGVVQAEADSASSIEYIVEAGKVWDEAEDNGYSRASIPFALQQRNQNCVHNGVLSFLFKSDGSVSDAAYQISSETCSYLKMDMWGMLDAEYVPQAISEATQLKNDHQRYLATRMLMKPISELEIDYPNLEFDLNNFGKGVSKKHMSAYGLVVGDTHYVSDCETRHGLYPFCDQLVLPSFSTAKSIFAGIGLMRLEEKYPGAKESLIGNLIPECVESGNWSDVTIENTIDMVSGNYDSASFYGDEDNASAFVLGSTHQNKINVACNLYLRKSPPGNQFVYHTSDAYLTATAMNAFLKSEEGEESDIYQNLLVEELWNPLNLSLLSRVSKRTYDDIKQAWGGYGLNLLRDDVAKIARFLNQDAGKIDGEQVLNEVMLRESLQQGDGAPYGVQAGESLQYYKNGFWTYQNDNFVGCGEEIWVPFMSGYGGIAVALFPNGMTYYYFSDNHEYAGTWVHAAKEVQKIKSMCSTEISGDTLPTLDQLLNQDRYEVPVGQEGLADSILEYDIPVIEAHASLEGWEVVRIDSGENMNHVDSISPIQAIGSNDEPIEIGGIEFGTTTPSTDLNQTNPLWPYGRTGTTNWTISAH